MANRTLMLEQLASVFEEEQAQVLAAVIYDSYNDLVRRDYFSDLKDLVREIAETQQRTDQHLIWRRRNSARSSALKSWGNPTAHRAAR